MKVGKETLLAIVIGLCFWSCGRSAHGDTSAHGLPAAECDEGLWNHVYRPKRLEVKQQCISVSGFIVRKKAELDGDYHIQLKLDPQYEYLLNDANRKHQNGNLVVELICERKAWPKDARSACANWARHTEIPPLGTHVIATGSYVLDTSHGWTEIHPGKITLG